MNLRGDKESMTSLINQHMKTFFHEQYSTFVFDNENVLNTDSIL